jgi:hypothetical protein
MTHRVRVLRLMEILRRVRISNSRRRPGGHKYTCTLDARQVIKTRILNSTGVID